MLKTPYDNYKFRAITGEAVDWSGFWITSQRFYHLPYNMKYGYNRIPEFNSDITNIHTLFNKAFSVEKDIKSARIFITGDDLYKLYINGNFVGEGPAQSYPFSYNYNCYDVSDLIKKGNNTIGVHLYYQGLFNIYLMSADNLCGMIAQLEISYTDGEVETIVSDRSWTYVEADAFSEHYRYGYQSQFSEDIDLSKWDADWYSKVGEKACVVANPYPGHYTLCPQITPPVKHERIYPEVVKKIENGYFLDFGKELTGSPVFSLCGKAGEVAEIRFGEELNDDGSVRFKLRANCVYSDLITMCDEEKTVEYFDYKGFRYMELLGVPKDTDIESLYVLNRHYSFPEKPAALESSHELINNIWKICTHCVEIGTQDTYYDCPTREKGGFIGDALITGLSHLILTGDARIYKKFITDCINTSRYCPVIMAHIPTYDINFCADYSLLVPLFLEEYYNYTGDMDFLKKSLCAAEGVLEYFSQFINDDNLLENIRHMENVPKTMEPLLIDWPPNLRDGYDMEKAKNGISTVINMFFYGFLKTLSRLYGITGNHRKQKELESLYNSLGESIIKLTYNTETHLFLDTPESTHSAIHSNALQMFFGLTPPDGFDAIVELIKQRRLNCGVYFSYFLLKGLYSIGRGDVAYDLLTGKDSHSWYNMLSEGATCCMEAWGKDQKANTSWCHPWSSSPIYFVKGEIMGIKSTAPGMKKIEIAPCIPDDIDNMHIDFPVPCGRIDARFERCGNKILYTVSAPDNIEIIFRGDNIEFKRI